MIEASGQRRDELCAACFDGHYPIALPDDSPMSAVVRALDAEVDDEPAAPTPDARITGPRIPTPNDSVDAVRRP